MYQADHERACSQLGQGCKDRIEIAIGARIQDMEFQPEGTGRRLQSLHERLSKSAGRVDEHGNGGRRRQQFVQQLQPLLPLRLRFKLVTPVRLPPGRFRLATSPILTGSAATAKTIGMVAVAALAAIAEGVPPPATITAT